jgi:DNA helicase II / ATP-dependent DNA helicase PcrA
VTELGKPDIAATVHAALQHLIVDEYQDVNPAQERLIRQLTGPQVERIAETIKRLHEKGLPYRSIAVLVRSRAAYPRLLDAFDAHGVPVQPAGRTGLFARPEAQMFGKTYAWLVDHRWSSEPHAWGEIPADDEVFDGYRDLYGLDDVQEKHVRERLLVLKASVPSEDRPVSLAAGFCELPGDLGAAAWDAGDPVTSARLGTLARCSPILAGYEAVRRRSRPHPEEAGAQTGGQDRGSWYCTNLRAALKPCWSTPRTTRPSARQWW